MIGDHGVVVPSALVERVLEVDLSNGLPLARAWVGGLGVSEGTVFIAIDLTLRSEPSSMGGTGGTGTTGTTGAICVLLDTGERTGLRWALRVSRTVGFVDVTRCARPSTLPSDWPTWITGALFKDKATAGLLDVAAMTRDFAT